ncbi:MAG: hypothetical protein A3C81_00855 [Candidatus Yanofskybacteria bacterium RIFCSPHIGHO2_02_FULL_46_19]|uniref:Uncharacterized protein n=2 Tax=Candidatus Yanofskyibacteriota TaxID=1752733 RepID=A0A1F8FW39_9BACT|nr:MAG: hypothetical protein A3C81_00855 [Candidatus Yanofskybacteria bacterium RIFCSPHIGHO2_02_FULL_46_19]
MVCEILMYNKSMNQKGFAPLILILVIVGALTAIGGGTWYYQQPAKTNIKSAPETEVIPESFSAPVEQPKQQAPTIPAPTITQPPSPKAALKPSPTTVPMPSTSPQAVTPPTTLSKTCARPFSPKLGSVPYYTGPLFDAHFHMPSSRGLAEMMSQKHGGETTSDPVLGKDVTLEEILCFFNKEEVKGAIGFYALDPTSLGDTLEVARNIKEESLGSIALFLMPITLDAEKLDSLHQSNAGLFKGYGELGFYDVWLKPLTPSDPKLFNIYKVAKKHGLIVMMHPDAGQKSNIETALQNNPGVNFLLHGFQAENYIADLIDRYPNVYFSIDSAVLYPMMGLFMSGPKEVFISRFEQEFDSMLSQNISKWKGTIERYPNRFMWGTDRGVKWHYNEEISILFEEFARAFIARLDLSVQENYAYKNAEGLLQKR